MQMNARDVDAVCGLVLELCGVYLDERKAYLIESRLSELLNREGCQDYVELVNRVRRTNDLGLKHGIIDAITTGETHFFRDSSPFDALKYKALPETIDRAESSGAKSIRIWSAACSTGQEPYSIAMTVRELVPDVESYNISILATDISNDAIAKASRGLYTQHEIERGLPPNLLNRYFSQVDNKWQIDDRVRAMVAFRQRNLHDSFSTLGKFDIIFCRNVAIYFTPDMRRSLFERLTQNLTKSGYLFVGSSEILSDLGDRFRTQSHCRSVFYQPNLNYHPGHVTARR